MCRSDVNARRQPLKNLRKHRQERQNSRFELLPEVRERCQKSKKIDARAYVNEGSLQGRSRWPKPFQNPSPKHPQSLSATMFFSYFCPRAPQERPKSVQERSKSASRAPQERPRAPESAPRAPQERPKSAQECSKSDQGHPKSRKICKNTQKRATTYQNTKKTHENAQNLSKTIKNALPRPG